jgi:UTP--glucose-1-phosphate uridylyltransferase
VLLGDDIVRSEVPCLRQMLDIYEEFGGNVIAIQEVPDADVSKYGIIAGEQVAPRVWRIHDLVEKPSLVTRPRAWR